MLRRTVAEFKDDELADRAAALTYYGILDNLTKLTPGSARDITTNAVTPTPPEQWSLGSVMQVITSAGTCPWWWRVGAL
ncbi:hypothetical protein [Streptomyces nigrescens]|uniref:hypothetical protein n=1 Tax=Streptomyces nigrescens TaxID=1920 RepID=UPI003607AFDE